MYWKTIVILFLMRNLANAQNKRNWQTGHRGNRPSYSSSLFPSSNPIPPMTNYAPTSRNYQQSYWTFFSDNNTKNFNFPNSFRGNPLRQFGSQSLSTPTLPSISGPAEDQTDWAEKRLIKDLLMDYEKQSRPVVDNLTPQVWVTNEQVAQQITVEFGLELLQILDLDEMDQVLTTSVRSLYKWTDHNLIWDPNNYGGIDSVTIPTAYLWLPDISLYNYADERLDERRPCDARIMSDGTVHWHPMAIFKSTCSVDIKYFPFDRQKCLLKFGPWSYDGFRLNISFYAGERNFRMTNYMTNPEWIILNSSAVFTEISYPCCPEKYPDISFHLSIKRQSAFYTYILIIPSILLSSLTSVIFWLPPHSPSKIVLAMNVFVAFLLLHLLLEDTTPAAASDFPLLGAYYCFNMAIITVSMFFSCITVNLHFLMTYTRAPEWFKMCMTYIGSIIAVDVNLLRKKSVPEKVDQANSSNFSSRQTHPTYWNLYPRQLPIHPYLSPRSFLDAYHNTSNTPIVDPYGAQLHYKYSDVAYEQDRGDDERGSDGEVESEENEHDSNSGEESGYCLRRINNIFLENPLWIPQTKNGRDHNIGFHSEYKGSELRETVKEPSNPQYLSTKRYLINPQSNYNSIMYNENQEHRKDYLSKGILFRQSQCLKTTEAESYKCALCHSESVLKLPPSTNCMNSTKPTFNWKLNSDLRVTKSCQDLSNDACSSTDYSFDSIHKTCSHYKSNTRSKIKHNSSPITYFPLANSLNNKLTVARIRKDIHFITNAARQLQLQHEELEVTNSIKEEWNVIGIILDRLFFIVYVVTLIISSFLFHPTILHVYVNE